MKSASLAWVLLLSVISARALVVTVDSVQYDISTISTSFDASTELLTHQPWWGSSETAEKFAAEVGDAFEVAGDFWGPYFAYASDSQQFFGVFSWTFGDALARMDSTFAGTYRFAIAEPVAEAVPDAVGTLPLALFGFAALPFARRHFGRRRT